MMSTQGDYWVDYSKSYWKAVELQEKVEQGKIKIHKNYIKTVIDVLKQIQKSAFTQPWLGRKCSCGKELTQEDFLSSQGWHCKACFERMLTEQKEATA